MIDGEEEGGGFGEDMMTVIRQFNEDDQHVIAKKGDKLILTTIVPEAYIIDHCLSLANATNDWGHSIILIKLKNISSTNISLQKLRDNSWTRQAQEKVTLAFAQVGTGEVFPTFPHMSSSPRLPFPFHHQPPCLLPKLPNSLQPPWKAPSRHH